MTATAICQSDGATIVSIPKITLESLLAGSPKSANPPDNNFFPKAFISHHNHVHFAPEFIANQAQSR